MLLSVILLTIIALEMKANCIKFSPGLQSLWACFYSFLKLLTMTNYQKEFYLLYAMQNELEVLIDCKKLIYNPLPDLMDEFFEVRAKIISFQAFQATKQDNNKTAYLIAFKVSEQDTRQVELDRNSINAICVPASYLDLIKAIDNEIIANPKDIYSITDIQNQFCEYLRQNFSCDIFDDLYGELVDEVTDYCVTKLEKGKMKTESKHIDNLIEEYMSNRQKTFVIIEGSNHHCKQFHNMTLARQWAENNLDLSKEIIVRQIDEFIEH